MNLRYKIGKRIMGKAAPEDFDKAPGYGAFLSLFGDKKKTGEIPWNDYTAQRREYRGTTFACIRKIAPAVAAAGLHLYVPEGSSIRESKRMPIGDETKAFLSSVSFCKMIMTVSESVEEVTQHPALDVFKRANDSMSRHQLFDLTMINLTLHGNCYWHPVLNEAGAFPAMIQTFSPTVMKPDKDKEGRLIGYKLKRGLGRSDKKFKLDEIVHFWYPNPYSNVEGMSPVAAASQRISAEVNTATFQNSTLENMGVPAAMVKILRQMPPERFKEFKKEFKDLYNGVANAGGVGFTQGEWEIEKLGQTLQEMGYIEGSKMLREFIANDLQVPLSKLTMESSNRAVAEAGNTEFLRDTILPNLVLIAEELTESLIPRFPMLKDAGAFYMFDNPVPEDMRTKMLMRRINRTTGTTTPNEEREEDGREPHDSPEADSLAMIRSPMPEQGETEATRALDVAMGKLKGELGI
jgi:HK97 family phage portal protein